MNTATSNHEDLVSGLDPIVAGSLTVLIFALWVVTLFLRGRTKPHPTEKRKGGTQQGWVWHLTGFVLVSAGTWFALQLLGHFVTLATSWPLLAIALGTGLAAETILALYQFERSLVKPGRGRWIAGLRIAALAILALILAQPVLSFLQSREIEREVAILVDESDSMLLSDQRLSPTEMLDRAALLSVAAVKNRPAFATASRLVRELEEALDSEAVALRSAPSPMASLEGRAAALPELFSTLQSKTESLEAEWTALLSNGIDGEIRGSVDDYRKKTRDGLARILERAETAAGDGEADELLKQLDVAKKELTGITDTLAKTRERADEAFLRRLDSDGREAIESAAAVPRLELARATLNAAIQAAENEEEVEYEVAPLLDQLAESYNLRIYRFARDLEQIDDDSISATGEVGVEWSGEIGDLPGRARTDLAGALDHILENTSPESLAGVMLLSDGRHNADALPEDSLRRLAVQNSPLSAVPIGGRLGPVDISLLGVRAPESVYLDDRVVVRAEAKLNGVLGKKVTAELLCDGVVADTLEIDVTDVSYRTELNFIHRPESDGIVDYKVRLQPDEREIFRDNNEWDFKVAVTDDRTNVLLVDGVPRWEFRYLRNLFYGRDKSVHLQYVLLQPDEVYRGRRPDPVSASATRPFGQAEATQLPSSPEEWALFDVIILGDVSPSALSHEDWTAIEETVTKRGALLVCVAGSLHMPHGFSEEKFRNLVPVTYEPGSATHLESPEPAFHVALTAAGQNHPITAQSTSRALNDDRWSSFPAMRWRYVPGTVKETAEVLAYANPVGTPAIGEFSAPDGSPGSVEAALEQLANRKQLERENSLIVASRAGLGKVLMLNFDQTWRFRYGVGDTYHHRFWGQVTRWGAGEGLRSGNDRVRLGTDRLTYTPDDSVEILTKVLDEDRRPVTDAELEVEIYKDGERLGRQKLGYRTDSSGLYETTLSPLRDEGGYELKLTGDPVDDTPDGSVSTELLVVTSRNPVELAELTADRDFLARATSVTGGRMVELGDLTPLLSSFGAPKETLTEQRNVTLWDTWPLLVAFLGFLTTEWIIRRRSGLV